MPFVDERVARLALAIAPPVIVALGYRLLPSAVIGNALDVLIAWLTVSLPIGVLVGHCVLSDADR